MKKLLRFIQAHRALLKELLQYAQYVTQFDTIRKGYLVRALSVVRFYAL